VHDAPEAEPPQASFSGEILRACRLGPGAGARLVRAHPRRVTRSAVSVPAPPIARLALADRISAASTLAAGVAHELNNPLAYVTANLAFLAEGTARMVAILRGAPATPGDADLAAQLHEAMREARSGADRMRAVVRDLKTFACGERDDLGPVQLGPVLDACVNLAWNEIRSRARLSRHVASTPAVLGNEGRLAQLFLNLIVNAAQSIPAGRPDDHEVALSARALDDGRVAVEVRDTGCGIPEADLPRIFDPFFTTKPPGAGTGLGLSICHAIVAAAGGEIEVESAPGRGSTYRVLLAPATGAGAARAPAARPGEEDAGPRARILIVDDEPLVGKVLRRTLTEHDVTVVETGAAALARLSAGERYDLVLCDLLMPGMTGMDVYRALAREHPSLARRVVFLTGGAFTSAARDFLDQEQVECVEKPFEVDALRAVIARRVAEP
jgi:signal transduction histidine kinase/CheY-like chemotaxis protein